MCDDISDLTAMKIDMLNQIPSGVGIFDMTGSVIDMRFVNDGFYKMIGEKREGRTRYYSTGTIGSVHPDDREGMLEEGHAAIKENRLFEYRFRNVKNDGSYIWIGIRASHKALNEKTERFYASYYNVDNYITEKKELEAHSSNLDEMLRKMKIAEKTMEETRRMYEAAVQETNLVVWEYDIVNHRIIMAENEFTRYDYRKFGLPKITENAPQSLVPYIADVSVPKFLEMYRKIDAGEPRANCEVWYKINPGTEPRCEHISYTTLFDAEGNPIKAYGIGQNITNRKMAEAEYDRMRSQLTSNLNGVISSTQLNISKNRYINGYSPYEWVKKSLEKETADEHFEAAISAVADENLKSQLMSTYSCANLLTLFQNGKQKIESTYPVKTSKGGIMWVRTGLQLMLNPSTGDLEGISYSKDITEQKRTSEIVTRLSSTGCDYIGVIDVSQGSFNMHTDNWGFKFIRPGHSMGYDIVRNRLTEEYVSPEKRKDFLTACKMDNVIRALDEKAQYTVAYDFADSANNGISPKKQIIFSWLNEDKREILCIQQDVTEAYSREQEQIRELERAKNEADAANEAKSAFLSGMSHDLRTPLNGVLSFTTFALEEKDPNKKQDYIRKIDTSGRLLLDLINDTLEMSRIESGKSKLEIDAVMPADLIPAVTTSLRPAAELKNITYEAESFIDSDLLIWCDRLKMQKIALNLISNAIKYTPDGGKVNIRTEILDIKPLGSCYTLTVEDSGIGMSEEFIKNMYEPFSQEKRSESIKQLGTGLGLFIVKRYVDLMGGKITVNSKIHNGTRIQVYIPINTGKNNISRIKKDQSSLKSLTGKKVLLCEDNIMNTEIAVMLLKDRGMVVETAENGKEGLKKFEDSDVNEFDLILMDIRMPVMDGYETVKRIRSLQRDDSGKIPIIAMTADAFEESVREAKLTGMNAYVTKPIDPITLYKTMALCLDGKENIY
jgi:signal transduction histidine kinase/ActR/RegA family two-component response regulator